MLVRFRHPDSDPVFMLIYCTCLCSMRLPIIYVIIYDPCRLNPRLRVSLLKRQNPESFEQREIQKGQHPPFQLTHASREGVLRRGAFITLRQL